MVPNLRIFYFCTKRCVLKNYRVLIGSRIKAFSNFSPKIPTKKVIFGPKFTAFIFVQNFAFWRFREWRFQTRQSLFEGSAWNSLNKKSVMTQAFACWASYLKSAPAEFSGHKHCGSRDMMVLACHVISQDHVIKESCWDCLVGSPSQ